MFSIRYSRTQSIEVDEGSDQNIDICPAAYVSRCLVFDTNCICDQRRLRRACAKGQSRQSLPYSLIKSMDGDEGSSCLYVCIRMTELFAYWVILHAFSLSADYFQNHLFSKFFQEYHQSAKQFGSKLFAKVISRRH